MESTSRPLTKRLRAALACNTCRQTKSKCNGERPACGRCTKQNIECVYSQNVRDKRMERQEERKARWALKTRVQELEAQLATVSGASRLPTDAETDLDHQDMASPAQAGNAAVSEAGSRATNPESTTVVDVLAAGVFDHKPVTDMGYFGPSSNHAMYRTLTHVLASAAHRWTYSSQDNGRHSPADDSGQVHPSGPSAIIPEYQATQRRQDADPGLLTAIQWITRFSDTVGAVLPYVNESALLREVHSAGAGVGHNARAASSQSVKALLNIVFAHTLSTMGADAAEPFYHKAISLLLADEQAVCNSSLESVQALLLVGSYEQNSQRAMASLITHSLAVKASYQLGLQSPSSYEGLSVLEKELRAKLWFAVVNQDILLGASLGRPLLIPPHYVRSEILESLAPMRQGPSVSVPTSMENFDYFRHLISLHEIIGFTLDTVYGSNIGLPSDLSPSNLITRTIEILSRLGQWNERISPFSILDQRTDLTTWGSTKFYNERFVLLLSLYYCRAVLIASGPVVMSNLEKMLDDSADTSATRFLENASISVLKTDLQALRDLQRIESDVIQLDAAFFRRNAVWWVCNFAAFTMCLHLFAFWLMSMLSETIPRALGITSAEAEALLLQGLDTLKQIGGSSIMSSRAYQCLNRYMKIAKALASAYDARRPRNPPGPVDTTVFPDPPQNPSLVDSFAREGFGDFNMTSLDDLFCQLGDNDVFGSVNFGADHAEQVFNGGMDIPDFIFDGSMR